MRYYQTALLRSSAPLLTYHSIDEIDEGAVVTVPLKNTTKQAIVISQAGKPDFDTDGILNISRYFFTHRQMEIAKFISEYYFSSFSEAISLFLPYVRHSGLDPESPAVSGGILNDRRKHPWAQVQDDAAGRIQDDSDGVRGSGFRIHKKPILTPAQQKAYESILQKDRSLLFGVTGSGKTEIFISLMIKMLEEGKSSMFLMPEISLTPQMEKRLKVYFGDTVAMWHSKITKKKKQQILEGIGDGTVRIVAGARSALFTPLRDLGLVIVDEEHDDSYKAMTRPRYHARDVAVLMGQKLGARVVLASATPSAASYHKYPVVRLEQPFVQTQKQYRFISGEGITPQIIEALRVNYASGGQSLVFVPTRGNFKYLYCQNCGQTHKCPYCSVGMALHRKSRHLRCHYCNYTEPIRESCLACGYSPLTSERMGTQEAIEMITEEIDGIQIEQFDKDAITTANKLKKALERFDSGQSHVLLGTQMLSKGHDYANITLSVITGIDYIGGMADYRARERAMSLLVQIAGRSGRAKAAKVIIQTAAPQLYQPYLRDYALFLKDELGFREAALYPPFAHLARILISHKDESKASKITLDTVTALKGYEDIEIIGHGKAPVERIANKYRFHILLRADNRVPLLKALHAVNCREIEIDMDAVEFS